MAKAYYETPHFLREKGARTGSFSSEKGIALVMVIVLSGVLLAVMTAVIYMITSGTQVSGIQKRYKTALDAGQGGTDVFYQFIALRGQTADQTSLVSTLNTFGLNSSVTTSAGCSGTSGGTTYTGLAAKFMTPSTSWSGCDSSISIDTGDSTSYDMKAELGTTTKYNVYAKIVATSAGNTGGDVGLLNKGVVSSNTGEVSVAAIPYLYAIEVVAENSEDPKERARLSVLYQY